LYRSSALADSVVASLQHTIDLTPKPPRCGVKCGVVIGVVSTAAVIELAVRVASLFGHR
jgi:hypothetical protein